MTDHTDSRTGTQPPRPRLRLLCEPPTWCDQPVRGRVATLPEALAVNAGVPVRTESLVRAVWQDDPPSPARSGR